MKERKILFKLSLFWCVITTMVSLLWIKNLYAQAKEYSLGVTYIDEPVSVFKRWEPFGAHLSKILNANVKVVPLDFNNTIQWVELGKVQLIITNPLAFMIAKDRAQLVPIGVVIGKSKLESGDRYGSVLIVKADSPIKSIHDFPGKTVGIASRFSLGGGLGGLALIEQEGVKIDQFVLKELKTQDNVVFSVLNGTVDVGIVRTGMIEKLVSEKKMEFKDIKVIHKVDDGFPLVHSTPLWPEWILAARSSDLTQQEIDQVKKNVLALGSSNSDLLAKCSIGGFKEPTEALSASAQFLDTVIKIYQKLSK